MQYSKLLLIVAPALFLVVLLIHAEESQAVYPYAIRGFVQDVRHNPLRFISILFFKKAFLLKKLKLKWKLKKKFVLKKLLKKLFLSQAHLKHGLIPVLPTKLKAILPQIFTKNRIRGHNEPHYRDRGQWTQNRIRNQFHIPANTFLQQSQLQLQHYHRHNHFHLSELSTDLRRLEEGQIGAGRKRRAIRFPDEHGGSPPGGSSSSSISSSSPSFSPSYSSSPSYPYHHHSGGSSPSSSSGSSSSSRAFFDEDTFDEFQSIGLGEQELQLLRQLPESLQYEYKQEMEDLETSASEPREADIVEYLTATNEFDTDHCIAKGICEVMSRGNRTSNRFENLLLEYYNEEPVTRKDPTGAPAYIYDYAAFLGKSRQDERACASYFPKCPQPTHQLTNFMSDIFSSEMCDPPVANELR